MKVNYESIHVVNLSMCLFYVPTIHITYQGCIGGGVGWGWEGFFTPLEIPIFHRVASPARLRPPKLKIKYILPSLHMYPQCTYTQKIRINYHQVHVTVWASVKCILICTSLLVLEIKIKNVSENVCQECWKVKKYGLSITRNDLDTLVLNWLNDKVEIVNS